MTQLTLLPRVSIVECNDLIRQLLTLWLEQAGFVVDHAAPGHRLSAELALIIANVHGADTAPHLVTSLRERSGAPLLLISARFPRGAARSETLARALNVQAVLPVPFTEAELMSTVRRILSPST